MNVVAALKKANKYTDATILGQGALKGEKGEPGKDGITPHISDNGNWYIGDYDTNVKAGGSDGNDGFTPIVSENFGNTDNEYRLKIINKNGEIVTPNLKGTQGLQGIPGEQGKQGNDGQQGIQGIKGDKGDDGYPFLIYKEYISLDDFNSSDFPQIGLMFMIKDKSATSFPVYRYTGEIDNPYSFITNLSSSEAIKGEKGDTGEKGDQGVPGKDGIDGTTYIPIIGTVTSIDSSQNPTADIIVDQETKTANFNFGIPKGEKGNNGEDGQDGITPHIGNNKNWYIGDIDTGVLAEGKDGRSIEFIEKDNNNNIIVTFSDNTVKNIGKLTIDVSADFLTSDGFGNLRYYNGNFQAFKNDEWVDVIPTPDNVISVNITPKPMQKFIGAYDKKLKCNKLKWLEPSDTILDGQLLCIIDKVIIRRKKNSIPENENDGIFVKEVIRKEFGNYNDIWYIDNTFIPLEDDIWYYKAFPVSTIGFVNTFPDNECIIEVHSYNLLGFRIKESEADPYMRVEYTNESINLEPAHMDFENGKFDYGDFSDFWFITNNKPVMLNYDGTEAYELDPNDYTKKLDGSESDVENLEFEGNAMARIPKVYLKMWEDDTYKYCNICDEKIDNSYTCYAHTREDGSEMDCFYYNMFKPTLSDGKTRSIKGKTIYKPSFDDNILKARENGELWEPVTYSQINLINMLLILITKTTDIQDACGYGHYSNGSGDTSALTPGGAYNKGQFWGGKNMRDYMKVFHIENYYGDCGPYILGLRFGESGNFIIKPNRPYESTEDYIDTGVKLEKAGFVNECSMTEYGMLPKTTNGSSDKYYSDVIYVLEGNKIPGFSSMSGYGNSPYYNIGLFCWNFSFGGISWTVGSSLSCEQPKIE